MLHAVTSVVTSILAIPQGDVSYSRRLAEWKVSAMRRLEDTVYLASTTNVALTAGCEPSRLGMLNMMMFCTVPTPGELKRW